MDTCGPERVNDIVEDAAKRSSDGPCICTCGLNRANPTGPKNDDDDAYGELFQRSLFATYDIHVEFERRASHIDRLIAISAIDEDASTLVEQLELSATLCPLRIRLQERSVEITRSGSMQDTGEPVYQFVHRIPYEGDTELWSLTPASAPIAPDDLQPGGETYRQRLILVVYACTREEAEEWLHHTLHSIQYVIDAQTQEVAAFNGSLRGLIWRQLVKHRSGPELVPMARTRMIH